MTSSKLSTRRGSPVKPPICHKLKPPPPPPGPPGPPPTCDMTPHTNDVAPLDDLEMTLTCEYGPLPEEPATTYLACDRGTWEETYVEVPNGPGQRDVWWHAPVELGPCNLSAHYTWSNGADCWAYSVITVVEES